MGEQNPDFFEYSSNIKIDRKITTDDNQIYIKDNDKWIKLLDENGNPQIKNIEILRNKNNKIKRNFQLNKTNNFKTFNSPQNLILR